MAGHLHHSGRVSLRRVPGRGAEGPFTKDEKISTGELQEFFDSGSMMVCDGEMVSPLIATTDPMLGMFKEAEYTGFCVKTASM